MEFVGREGAVDRVENVLQLPARTKSVWFSVKGNSGSGKTHLVKQAVSQTIHNTKALFCIYIDVNADEYESSNFFVSLVQQLYNPINHHYDNVTVVPRNLSLFDFMKKLKLRNTAAKTLLNITSAAISSIPYAEITALPFEKAMEWIYDYKLAPENLIWSYFEHITKIHRLNIIIDNYQFLPETVKRQFETGINKFGNGITLISIIRTAGDYNDIENYCDDFKKAEMSLEYVSKDYFELILKRQTGITFKLNNKDIEKMWMLTAGNLKNLELILNEIRINPGYDIISAQSVISNLDDVQKSILWIVALFPAGMRESYVIYAIQDILNEKDSQEIKKKIISLIHLGYIYLNSTSNDSIKPTHETIIDNVRKTVDWHDIEYFREALSRCLESIIYNNGKTADYAYLIHCWIGISTMENLKNNISIVEDLISIKSKENAYYYIDDIANKIKDVLYYFNEIVLRKIFIALQRVSDFQNGITILNMIKTNNELAYQKLKIFYAKFLIQTYNFEDALTVLNEMGTSTETVLCKLNVFQHLGMDSQAINLLLVELPICEKTDDYYIALRNSAHYYPYETAISMLTDVLYYFERRPFSNFVIATVKNNLGVVFLWNKEFQMAENYLQQAEEELKSLNSNEIFEPLCNLSICALLTEKFNDAINYASHSLSNCPRTLSLDILMLKINEAIILLCSKQLSPSDTFSVLKKLEREYNIIEDPWYSFQLKYNLHQLHRFIDSTISEFHSSYIDNYQNGMTKFYIIEEFCIEEHDITLCLGLSPNWRY